MSNFSKMFFAKSPLTKPNDPPGSRLDEEDPKEINKVAQMEQVVDDNTDKVD